MEFPPIARLAVLVTNSNPIAALMPPLHPALKSALEALPDSYDSDSYRSIFNTWGTHFYSMAILGGSAQYDAFFTKCLLDSYSSSYIKQQVSKNTRHVS